MTPSSDQTITLGITGCGRRGQSLVRTAGHLDRVDITAISSRTAENRDRVASILDDSCAPRPAEYDTHASMIDEAELDAVLIATAWDAHTKHALTALSADVHVGLEVGPAASIEECWQLVRAAERSDACCMLLENCCYGRDELAALRMVEEGVFGDLVHCECGYAHDLRSSLLSGERHAADGDEELGWRAMHHAHRTGDLYPTHGLGPIAVLLDINRGNRFVSLTATESKAVGLSDWADEHLPTDDPRRSMSWRHGDVISTTIRCANGETVGLTHSVTLPRPYSRLYTVQGTNGIWEHRGRRAPDGIYIDGESPADEWEEWEGYREEFEHPIWQEYLDAGRRGGHEGIDFLVLRAFVDTVSEGTRPPIDVYDAATWRAISILSARSIERGGAPVTIPDFTNGRWLNAPNTFPGPSAV